MKGYVVAAAMPIVSALITGLLVTSFVMTLMGIIGRMQQVVVPRRDGGADRAGPIYSFL